MCKCYKYLFATIESSRLASQFSGISQLCSAFFSLQCIKLAHIYIGVTIFQINLLHVGNWFHIILFIFVLKCCSKCFWLKLIKGIARAQKEWNELMKTQSVARTKLKFWMIVWKISKVQKLLIFDKKVWILSSKSMENYTLFVISV